jgi:hypothetical protein
MKLIPNIGQMRKGWESPFHFKATLAKTFYHLLIAGMFGFLICYLGVIFLGEPTWGFGSFIPVFSFVFLSTVVFELLIYQRMYKNEMFPLCKSMLIICPLFWIGFFVFAFGWL